MNTIIIELRGGVVVSTDATEKVNVVLIDWDEDKPSDIVSISQTERESESAWGLLENEKYNIIRRQVIRNLPEDKDDRLGHFDEIKIGSFAPNGLSAELRQYLNDSSPVYLDNTTLREHLFHIETILEEAEAEGAPKPVTDELKYVAEVCRKHNFSYFRIQKT